MLLRLLFTLALLGALIWFWRRSRRANTRPPQGEPSSETMVRCARCDIHLPQRLALQQHDHWYCCQEHLQQGPATRE